MGNNKKLNDIITKDTEDLFSVKPEDVSNLEDDFQLLLKEDPRYSLAVDPLHIYDFTEEETFFIEQMIQYKNVQFVATVLMNISLEEGVEIYKKYDVQSEIKRINLAMYARRFATKMADLDQLGGYLTSALTDENVPVADRLAPKDKLTASKLLLSINILKQKAIRQPDVIDEIDVQKDLDKLSPKELEQLIEYNDEDNIEKEKYISIINEDDMLSMEELKNLRMMTLEELKSLVEEITEGEIEHEEN